MCDCGDEHIDIHGRPSCVGHVRRCYDCWESVNRTDPECAGCGSTNIKERSACGGWRMKGLEVCRKHGGKSAQAKGLERWEREQAERQALKLLEKYEVDIDPTRPTLDEYDRALAMAVGWLDICQQQMQDLDSIAFETKAGERKLDARINLFERALDRVEKFLANAQHLDLDTRRVQLNELQVASLAQVWNAWLAEYTTLLASLLPDTEAVRTALTQAQTQAGEIAARHLRRTAHTQHKQGHHTNTKQPKR